MLRYAPKWFLVLSAGLTLVVPACKEKSGAASSGDGETEFVRGELAKLEQAITKRDESGALVGCTSVTASYEHMPGEIRDQIAQRCFTEVPRLILENAVADAKEHAGENPEFPDLNCMQLLAEDAFKTMREHPTEDPELKSLARDYTALCPDRVAKFGGPAASSSTRREKIHGRTRVVF